MEIENRWYVKYTYVMAGLILTIYAMIVAKSILLPLLFALFFSILLSPLCGWLESFKIPRFLSAFIGMLFAFVVILGIGFFFYNQMVAFAGDIDMFAERLEVLFESMEEFLLTWFAIEGEINLDRIVNAAIEYLRENALDLTRGVTGAAAIITATFLTPVFIFLILLFRDLLKNFVLSVFSQGDPEIEKKVANIIVKVKTMVQKYITGLLMVIAILAVINSTMLLIIGIDHAIFFGVFAAMLYVIPFLGPIMGSILPILYALITMDSLVYPIIILLGFYIIQLFESNLFTPVIVGSQVSMNALATLLLIIIGAQIWGLAGMILFIPIGAIFKVIFDEVDSLKPYGYLLGRETGDKSEERSALAKRINEYSKNAKKRIGLHSVDETSEDAEEDSEEKKDQQE